MERKIKGTGPLNLLKVTWARACSNGGKCKGNDCLPLCTSEVRISSEWSEHRFPHIWRTESNFCPPWLLQGACAKPPGAWVEQEVSSCCCIRSWNWPKLTVIDHSHLLLKVTNRLQGCQIVKSDQFSQENCCLGGERDSWCLLLHPFPRISMMFSLNKTSFWVVRPIMRPFLLRTSLTQKTTGHFLSLKGSLSWNF